MNCPTDRKYQFDATPDDWGGWMFILEKIICRYISSDISIYFSRYIGHIAVCILSDILIDGYIA